MMTFENPAGRLFVIRMASPVDSVQAETLEQQGTRTFAALLHPAVVCGDLRGVDEFVPDIAERVIAMLRVSNVRLERSAIVIGASSRVAMQVARILRGAEYPGRRVFTSAETAISWLDDALGPEERTCLAAFLTGR